MTMPNSNSLKSLIYERGDKPSLKVLDQLLIPKEKVWVDIPDVQSAWSVIRNMQIRGAPLIAVVAVLGLAVDLKGDASSREMELIEQTKGEDSEEAIYDYIQKKIKFLASSRPTAVNLFNALEEVNQKLVDAKNSKVKGMSTTPRQRMVDATQKHAEFMLQRDIQDNKNIGKNGADQILKGKRCDEKVTIMTICNTGTLASTYYGTALGVVRAIHERGRLKKVIALETRPYNQGSRLTAFEIVEDTIPGGTLICDGAAAAQMKECHVDAVVVGADRVCSNGDTANKIGTYNLAVVAAAHKVPLYIASPFTSFDISLQTGDQIEIEVRPPEDFIASSGAPPNMPVWNPTFDVTPARYIAGIITEKGVIHPEPDGSFKIAAFVSKHVGPLPRPDHVDNEEEPSRTSFFAKLVLRRMKIWGKHHRVSNAWENAGT